MERLQADDPGWAGDYRLLARVGSGGMGRVYLARRRNEAPWVAVKLVRAEFAQDGEFRERFRREVSLARRAGGAWTAPVLDADTESSRPWVATAFVQGPSLDRAVQRHGPLPEASVRTLVAGLAEALDGVHSRELVHRDVKPANVLLALDGPRLIDFGIARATDASVALTRTGVVVGSPGYMSPEQVVGGEVGPPTDVFTLGAVLVFAATGHGPFPGDGAAGLMYKVVHEEPDLGGLSGRLREVAAACLAKDPAARPAAGETARMLAPDGAASLAGAGWLPSPVVADVQALMRELVNLPAPADTVRTEPAGPPRRRKGPLLLAAATAAALAASATVFVAVQAGGDGGNGGDVPGAFLGTWEGQLTTRRDLPGGTLRITITQGTVGDVVSTDAAVSMQGVSCTSDYLLTTAEDDRLVLETRSSENGGSSPLNLCVESTETARVTLRDDGRLHYASLSEEAGFPEGDLSRAGEEPAA
ncbi:serine/threonine-protein kinase [Streptomyces sp. NPDC093991]|uniref:serine/threonine-protein kinase n=1 Tax=unclassified Streptomyces TaxID=2593676 RepID=UPI00343E448E